MIRLKMVLGLNDMTDIKDLTAIQIETLNYCNARCTFCPLSVQMREKGYMDDVTFAKIIQECKTAPNLKFILPYLNSEPFMDKTFFERFDYVIKELPHIKYVIFTNGGLINDDIITELEKRSAHIEKITVSISYCDEDSYEKHVGLNWKILNIILSKLKNSPIKEKISLKILQSEGNNLHTVKAFIDKFSKEFSIVISRYLDWSGKTHDKLALQPSKKKICDRVKTDLVIYWDGRVSLCCIDNEGDVILGDINNDTLNDIYNSTIHEKYIKLMYNNEKHKLPLCKECNMVGGDE